MTTLFQFPEPYPGECLYSILCRFHERSGNRTDAFSIIQLFGKHRSIRSTVYSPAALDYADHWFEESDVINAGILRDRHTLLHYGISINECNAWRSSQENELPNKCWSFSRTIIHEGKRLRFCPVCVQQQREIYGEPYWQLLPQTGSANVCPIHGEVYRLSKVTMGDTAYRFHSASSVLYPVNDAGVFPANLSTIESHFDACLLVSKEVNWIIQNCIFSQYRTSRAAQNFIIQALKTKAVAVLDEGIRKCGYTSQYLITEHNISLHILYLSSAFHFIFFINYLFGSMDAFQKQIQTV